MDLNVINASRSSTRVSTSLPSSLLGLQPRAHMLDAALSAGSQEGLVPEASPRASPPAPTLARVLKSPAAQPQAIWGPSSPPLLRGHQSLWCRKCPSPRCGWMEVGSAGRANMEVPRVPLCWSHLQPHLHQVQGYLAPFPSNPGPGALILVPHPHPLCTTVPRPDCGSPGPHLQPSGTSTGVHGCGTWDPDLVPGEGGNSIHSATLGAQALGLWEGWPSPGNPVAMAPPTGVADCPPGGGGRHRHSGLRWLSRGEP